MPVINVNTSRGNYDVHIGNGLLSEAGAIFGSIAPGARAAIVTDSNVEPLHAGKLRASLDAAGIRHCTFTFPAGEASKTLDTAAQILNFLAEERFTRTDALIALGGGVTGDLAGFAAAIYLRGIKVMQIPTTFLAAIDSSVGGKTGVDLPAGKNLAGAFWQPAAVLCDPELLHTLPPEVFSDGTAEAIKYGVIADRQLFEVIASGALRENLDMAITRCIGIKADIVGRDEFDRGDRALLNFGHTIGHAVEKRSDFGLSHGRGVAIGMVIISRIAAARGWCDASIPPDIAAALALNGLPWENPYPAEELLPFMLSDKKRAGDTITLVVPETLGRCVRREVPVAALPQLMNLKG